MFASYFTLGVSFGANPASAGPSVQQVISQGELFDSIEKFDPLAKNAAVVTKSNGGVVWTKKPIKAPMLESTPKKNAAEALKCFADIQLYMGDGPKGASKAGNWVTLMSILNSVCVKSNLPAPCACIVYRRIVALCTALAAVTSCCCCKREKVRRKAKGESTGGGVNRNVHLYSPSRHPSSIDRRRCRPLVSTKHRRRCQVSQAGYTDEVYVQLVKQTTGNPNPAACCRGWEVLCGCAHVASPSDGFLLPFVLRHAHKLRLASDPTGALALRTWQRLLPKEVKASLILELIAAA